MARADTRHSLKVRLTALYRGRTKQSERFRYALLVFDVVTIGFFVVVSMVPLTPWVIAADLVLAVLLGADFVARLIMADSRARHLLQPVTIADAVVVASLILAPFVENLAFLRVLRTLRLVRSYHVLADLRRRYSFFRANEDVLVSVANLLVFLFVVTAFVYVLQAERNDAIETYVDALYFTVATLTTTGFGDITLEGDSGRLLSVVIMVVGLGLFLRLIQTIFRPRKVRHTCPTCGLARHDPDAVHCKHCGETLYIRTEGEG
jgi:voltage-gated potassium channel